MDSITETPKANTVEEWQIYNNSVDIHPIHLHGGHFQVVDRYPLTGLAAPIAEFNTLPSLVNFNVPSTVLKNPVEGGWKDTVMASALSVTRIRVKFEGKGLAVWHCHILEHEDHDMMRPLLIQP
jgi:spore coat protein A